MWTLEPPKLSVREVVEACGNACNVGLKSRVLDSVFEFEQNSIAYQARGQSGELYGFDESMLSFSRLTRDEVHDLYERLRRKDGRARHLYEAALAEATLHRCTYCGANAATTIDHVLPRIHRPEFSIDPWNFVPACKDCNFAMLDYLATGPSDEVVHPRFWEDKEAWLRAEVLPGLDPVAEFSVQAPDGWSEIQADRVRNQFETLELRSILSMHAPIAIIEYSASITSEIRSAGSSVVEATLLEFRDGARVAGGPNYWRTVLLDAMANNSWFCSDGLRLWSAV